MDKGLPREAEGREAGDTGGTALSWEDASSRTVQSDGGVETSVLWELLVWERSQTVLEKSIIA